jgi:hypothetical protein
MQNSPGKVRRIFHKKRHAFEKKNPPQPPDFTTRLNKVHQDFAALQSIANKAQGNARTAEREKFDSAKNSVLTNLDKVQKHLKPHKTKETYKPFYKTVWQTILIVERFDLQTLDAGELDTVDDERAFDGIDFQTREANDGVTPPPQNTPPNDPPPPTPQQNTPNVPPRAQDPPQTTPTPPRPQQTTPQSPRVVNNTRRQLKGNVVIKPHTIAANKAMAALEKLHNAKDFDAKFFKTVSEAAKKGAFGEDKNMSKLADAVKAYTTLRDKPGSDPAVVAQAWKLVGNQAREYIAWAQQQYPNDIANKEGHKYERFKIATGMLDMIKEWDDNEAEISKQATLISRDVILALNESEQLLNGGKPKGLTANGTSVKLLEDMAKHPGLPSNLKASLDTLIAKARPILEQEAQLQLNGLTNPTQEDEAGILMEYGGCKVPPPDVKGTSDTFIIYGTDGKPRHFFKPMDGELRPGLDWPENGGATREILASKVSDVLGKAGIDCRTPKTSVVKVTDDTFKSGTISQKPDRVGAMIEAIHFSPGDPKNATEWFNDKRKDANGNLIRVDVPGQMAKLNPRECQSAMLMNFIMLDADGNAGNLLVTGTDGGPGTSHVTVIDAGRKLPSPEAFMRACGGMTLNSPPQPGKYNNEDIFLLQTPSALTPFDPEVIAKINQLDADQIVRETQQAYTDMVRTAPEMDNTVEQGSFDLMKKSIQFLKAAVARTPPLTPYDLSQIYATGFEAIVEAKTPQETATAIQNALNDYRTYQTQGGDAALKQRGIDLVNQVLTVQQKARILGGQPPINSQADFEQYDHPELQRRLQDIGNYIGDGPERITNQLTQPYSKENYAFLKSLATYKRKGGDAMLKKLIDCEETYRAEMAKGIAYRNNWSLPHAGQYFAKGGTPAFVKLVGQAKFDQDYRGKSITDNNMALGKALEAAKT